jgi:hypothetical protein
VKLPSPENLDILQHMIYQFVEVAPNKNLCVKDYTDKGLWPIPQNSSSPSASFRTVCSGTPARDSQWQE